MVSSPCGRGRRLSTSEIGPLTNSSCSFVSSRQTAISRSPSTFWRSVSEALSRWGASNKTTGLASDRRPAKNNFLLFDLLGGNPTKLKDPSRKPEVTSAARTALGPGTASTRRPLSRAARTSRPPGSETSGVPASLTTATDSPRASRASR